MVSPGMRKGRCQGLPPGTEVGPVVGSWTNATLRYDLLRNRRVGMANVSGGTTRAGPPPRAFIRLIISS